MKLDTLFLAAILFGIATLAALVAYGLATGDLAVARYAIGALVAGYACQVAAFYAGDTTMPLRVNLIAGWASLVMWLAALLFGLPALLGVIW